MKNDGDSGLGGETASPQSQSGASAIALVGKKRAIASGILVGDQDQAVSIRPFQADLGFELTFTAEFSDDYGSPSTLTNTRDHGVDIFMRATWHRNFSTGSADPWSFASDERAEYFFNYVFTAIGNRDGHTFALMFTVLMEERA